MHLRRGEEKCQSTFRSKIEDTSGPVVTRPPTPPPHLILSHFGSLSSFLPTIPLSFSPLFPPLSSKSYSIFPPIPNFSPHSSCFHSSTSATSDSLFAVIANFLCRFLCPYWLLYSVRVVNCGNVFFWHVVPNGCTFRHTSQLLEIQVLLCFSTQE